MYGTSLGSGRPYPLNPALIILSDLLSSSLEADGLIERVGTTIREDGRKSIKWAATERFTPEDVHEAFFSMEADGLVKRNGMRIGSVSGREEIVWLPTEKGLRKYLKLAR